MKHEYPFTDFDKIAYQYVIIMFSSLITNEFHVDVISLLTS